MYLPDGLNGDINVSLWPIQVSLHLRNCKKKLVVPNLYACAFSVRHKERNKKNVMHPLLNVLHMHYEHESPLLCLFYKKSNITKSLRFA